MAPPLRQRLGSSGREKRPHPERKRLTKYHQKTGNQNVAVTTKDQKVKRRDLTVDAVVVMATHAVSQATLAAPAAGPAAGVGGAFGREVAVASLRALQVAHALVELQENARFQNADHETLALATLACSQ